jgi:hypothetical protein
LSLSTARLEADAPDLTIPIHVEDEAGVPRRIDELITEGKLTEDDPPRCMHLKKRKLRRPMRHEDWVAVPDELEKG